MAMKAEYTVAPVIMTSLYEWKAPEWDVKAQTNQEINTDITLQISFNGNGAYIWTIMVVRGKGAEDYYMWSTIQCLTTYLEA